MSKAFSDTRAGDKRGEGCVTQPGCPPACPSPCDPGWDPACQLAGPLTGVVLLTRACDQEDTQPWAAWPGVWLSGCWGCPWTAQRPKSIAGILKDSVQHIICLWSSGYRASPEGNHCNSAHRMCSKQMPPLRGLLWIQVLCAGPLHTEAVVLLVPPDDGRALLLWCRLPHPEVHVPLAADRGAGIQRVLHQAAPEPHSRSPAAGAAVLHRPWRTRDESCWEPCGDGFAGPTQLTPWKHSLPTAPFLLQHATAPI